MQEKFNYLKEIFSEKKSEKEVYQQIISFGKDLPTFPKEEIQKENLVPGCQSELYLAHTYNNGKIKFFILTEALISKGLASILIYLYSDNDPKTLFTTPPAILKELNVLKNISMSRQVGISNLFKKMQLIASKYV